MHMKFTEGERYAVTLVKAVRLTSLSITVTGVEIIILGF